VVGAFPSINGGFGVELWFHLRRKRIERSVSVKGGRKYEVGSGCDSTRVNLGGGNDADTVWRRNGRRRGGSHYSGQRHRNGLIEWRSRPFKKADGYGPHSAGTEIVELSGDLTGKILYHVTTVIDNQKGTLTNTGDQVFSGTIAGSEPVMIHDSRFRFAVNLATGDDNGSVFLFDHIAGPQVKCELKVTGTGKTTDGNPTFRYTGTCRFGRGKADSKK
jgi:hypothetical protein